MSVATLEGPEAREAVAPEDGPVARRDPAVAVTLGDGAPAVVQTAEGDYLRLGHDAARLLDALDVARRPSELAERLGPPWTPELVRSTADRFGEMELLESQTRPAPRRRRLRYVRPLTVQLTLLDPERALRPVAGLLRAIPRRATAIAALTLAVAGLALLAAQTGAIGDALAQPPGLGALAALVGLLIAATTVHEFAHGAALVASGGRPSRLGVMLFYLMPAFFCDVSDAWRLPRRSDRVAVALAGPVVQTTLGALGAAVALATSGAVSWVALLFALLCYVQAVVNAVPFVKLDGYIALMSALDHPYLRRDAMRETRHAVAHRLLGTPRAQRVAGRWVPWYGLACTLAPVYLVLTGVLLWTTTLRNLGAVGTWMGSLIVLVGAWWLVASALRAASRARRAGAPAWRIGALAALGVAVVAAFASAPLPQAVPAGYVRTADGVRLVLPSDAAVDAARPGRSVTLERRGIVRAEALSDGTIAAGTPRDDEVPYAAATFLDVDLPISAPTVALDDTALPAGARDAGTATIDAGERPAWRALEDVVLGPLR
ncbi:daptide biosynthesis intramembrane metalloprotease [Patulibacter sp. NPDC049589]|uniref:daptide biosynthesis intramembrane metalloprotease n=1 Tax=Patulibacter sp. NPDC049589 TaxID=3154731 RepID=UPI00342B595B